MTKTVVKFPLAVAPETRLEIPDGAQVLAVAWHDRIPCLWALVDPEKPRVARTIKRCQEGHSVDDAGAYVGMITLGSYVYHFFDVTPGASL